MSASTKKNTRKSNKFMNKNSERSFRKLKKLIMGDYFTREYSILSLKSLRSSFRKLSSAGKFRIIVIFMKTVRVGTKEHSSL